MIRRCPMLWRRTALTGPISTGVVLWVLVGLAGCRGLPRASSDGTAQVTRPPDTFPTTGKTSASDKSGVSPASLQLSPPAAESDWLSGTRVVAIVNGEPVFASEILHRQSRSLAAAREQLPGPRFRALQDELIRKQLKGYVDRRLMSQAMLSDVEPDRLEVLDKQLGVVFTNQEVPQLLAGRQLQSVVELKRKLIEEGTSLEVLKEDFRQQQLAMEYLRQSARPRTSFSPSEMMAWYRAHLDEFQTTPRVRWRQILVSVTSHGDRDSALGAIESARRRLSAGEDFAALAKELSDGPAAADGGHWDWTDRESFKDQRVSDELFRLPVGTPSRVFEGPDYFQLVVANEREDGGAAKFETIQNKIEKRLGEENRVQEMERVVGALQSTAEITTAFDQPGQPFLQAGGQPVPATKVDNTPQPINEANHPSRERWQGRSEIRRERG